MGCFLRKTQEIQNNHIGLHEGAKENTMNNIKRIVLAIVLVVMVLTAVKPPELTKSIFPKVRSTFYKFPEERRVYYV